MQKNWIGGKWMANASGESIAVVNPASEETIDRIAQSNAADVDHAVQSAHHAFSDWRFVPGLEKAEKMHEFASRLRAKKEEIAVLMTRETGKTLIENRDEVEWVAACFD